MLSCITCEVMDNIVFIMRSDTEIKIDTTPWGRFDTKDVYLFKMTNAAGNYVELTNYGATLVNVVVPDKLGNVGSVVLGYDDLQGYINDQYYLGSTIGRFANRISNASFLLDGQAYHLDKNDGENSNHGGFEGYDRRVFDVKIIEKKVCMTLHDQDGNGGYPGTLKLCVTFTWSQENELKICYEAESTKPTIANFTNHAYFNLSGTDRPVTDHELRISAGSYLENNENNLPTGRILMDSDGFINGKRLSEIMDVERPAETGLNRYYTFLDLDQEKVQAELEEPGTGRTLQVSTSYPGILVYTAQYLETVKGRDVYKPLTAICLECQNYPDGINHEYFPPGVLRQGELYQEFIKFRFSAREATNNLPTV
jgi:aldose 1-epimerase